MTAGPQTDVYVLILLCLTGISLSFFSQKQTETVMMTETLTNTVKKQRITHVFDHTGDQDSSFNVSFDLETKWFNKQRSWMCFFFQMILKNEERKLQDVFFHEFWTTNSTTFALLSTLALSPGPRRNTVSFLLICIRLFSILDTSCRLNRSESHLLWMEITKRNFRLQLDQKISH